MNLRAARSSGRKAEAFIRRRIAEGGLTLPTMRTIAAATGVAVNTVAAAARRLAAEGLVRIVPGGGMFAAGAGMAPVANPAPRSTGAGSSRDDRVVSVFVKDLLDGAYAPGQALPPCKVLGERYGVSYPVLRRCLERLVSERRIERHRRWYRIRQPPCQPAGASVLLVTTRTPPSGFSLPFDRMADIAKNLERECALRGLGVQVFSLQEVGQAPGVALRSLLARSAAPLFGSIMVNTGVDRASLAGLCSAFAAAGRPAAFCEEAVITNFPSVPPAGLRYRRYAIGLGEECGRQVGEYLVARGHRAAAYFLTARGDLTRNRRLAGLRAAFAAAGMPDAIVRLGLDRYETDDPIENEARQAPGFRSLLNRATAIEREMAAQSGSPAPWSVVQPIEQTALNQYVCGLLEPLFEQALDMEQVTAWVLYNDREALAALAYLRRRGVEVPRRVAVVGFDNTVEAFGAGLTSYDFNVPAYVRSLLEFLERPPERTRPAESGVTHELPGFVVPRASG